MRFALVLLVALATPAAAEINMADSVEWQTIDSDVVVRGFVTSVKLWKADKSWWDVTFQITETIKGGVKKTLHFGTRAYAKRWQDDEADLLLFLVDGKDATADDKDAAQFTYVPRPLHGSEHNPLVLGSDRGYTSTFAALDKPTEIIAVARVAARSSATESHRVDVPWDTPAMKALYGGSAVWMTVPVDEELEKLALAWIASKGVNPREEGARALAHFRSDANIAIMKKLLVDPKFVTGSRNGGPDKKQFLVRVAAHEALTKWHVTHDAPVGDAPLTK